MIDQQLSLFTLSDPTAIDPSPGSRPRRRGRGATPIRRFSVELPKPNPAGRRRLTFAYRPLRAWSAALLNKVHELLMLYFARVGGCRCVRDATVRQWYDALADGVYTADELRAGIGAKADSLQGATLAETREKRCFACTPARFIRFADYWVEQSPEACAALATAEVEQRDIERQLQANREAAAALRKRTQNGEDAGQDRLCRPSGNRRQGPGTVQVPIPDPQSPIVNLQSSTADDDYGDLPPFLQEAVLNEAFCVYALDLLSPRQRRVVERQFSQERHGWAHKIINEHGGGVHVVKAFERYMLVQYALAAWPELRPRVFAAAAQPRSQANALNPPAAGAARAACGASQAASNGRSRDDRTVFDPASTAGFAQRPTAPGGRLSGLQTSFDPVLGTGCGGCAGH